MHKNDRFVHLRFLRNLHQAKHVKRNRVKQNPVHVPEPISFPPPNLTVITDPPRISILTAAYNCDHYLRDTIESVRCQTSPNWEMIICDDFSRDKSLKIALDYASKDQRIRVVKNYKRLYCSSTYGRLLGEARGQICGVLDGDDCLVPNAVETIIKAYDAYPELGFIYSQFVLCDNRLRRQGLGHSKCPATNLLDIDSQHNHCFSHWRTFLTELRDKGALFKPGLQSSVDQYLGYVLEEHVSGGFLDVPLYLYRQHLQGITATKDKRKNTRWVVINEAKERRILNNLTPYPIKLISV